jgi:hypothetical protein
VPGAHRSTCCYPGAITGFERSPLTAPHATVESREVSLHRACGGRTRGAVRPRRGPLLSEGHAKPEPAAQPGGSTAEMNAQARQASAKQPVVRRRDLDGPPDLTGRGVRRRLLLLAAVALTVVAVITLVPGLASLRTRLAHGDPDWLALGVALKVLSGISYGAAFRSVFCSRMNWRTSLKIGFSELGANAVLPIGGAGGLALGAWALRRGGVDAARIARRSVAFFFLTSVPNVLGVILLGIALATRIVPGRASLALTLGPAAVAAAAVLATILAGRWAGAAEQRISTRRGTGSRIAASLRAISEGVQEALQLLAHGGPLLVIALAGYLGFDVMILWATFHAFGSVPPLAIIWIGYLIGELGGLIPCRAGSAASTSVSSERSCSTTSRWLLPPPRYSATERSRSRSPS